MDRIYFIRKENNSLYHVLANLKTEEGKIAIKPSHLKIIEYIGSFEAGKGCFASRATMNRETINTTAKTFGWHLEYLLYIKAITITLEGEKTVYRLNLPNTNSVISQKNFRQNVKQLPSYHYLKTAQCEAQNLQPIKTEPCIIAKETEPNEVVMHPNKQLKIFTNSGENFSLEGDIFAVDREKFSPILYTTLDNTKEKLLPKVPPRSQENTPETTNFQNEVQASLRDVDVPQTAAAHEENPTDFPIPKKSFSEDQDWAEPLLQKKRIHKPKNERERRAEAMQLINNGHIVNPLGIRDNRKKQLNWKLARDFSETGAVTVPQLWRHLVKLWDSAFGEGILENMLSQDKSAIALEFDKIREQFVKNCNYEPDNRELASYFEWFLDSKRLSHLKSAVKFIHFRQLSGGVYIKRFYDEILSHKVKEKQHLYLSVSPAEEQSKIIEETFAEFRDSYQDNYKFALRMVQNGYALTAQFLHDELDLDDSQCRQRIIKVMAEFIKSVDNHEEAVKYLKKGLKTTEEHSPLLRQESCVWFDWKEKTKDLVEVAIEQSGIKING